MYIFLIIPYIVLQVFGFKSTWKLAVNSVLAGSSEIILPIILFVLMIFVIGPFIGLYNIIKYLVLFIIVKTKK